jgi:hypothetical protein
MPETPVTSLDPYRISGAGLDAVRPGIDVAVTSVNGLDWVDGSPTGGMSTRASIYRLRRPTSRWWRLPAGSPHSTQLVIRNDHGSHWLIEPATGMPLAQYRELLRDVNALFVLTLLHSVSG